MNPFKAIREILRPAEMFALPESPTDVLQVSPPISDADYAALKQEMETSFLRPQIKKLALVGGSESRDQTPWNDPAWDIWVLNLFSYERGIPRFTAWFETHQRPYVQGAYEAFLKSIRDQPVYMLDHYPEIPASVAYPLEAMIAKFGARYFTSTPAYMLALAIHQGYREIQLCGLAMRTGSEYAYERACMEWLIGYARRDGIEVTIHRPSSLLEAERLYGYEEAYTSVNINITPDELIAILGRHVAESAAWSARLNDLNAYLKALEGDPTLEPPMDFTGANINIAPEFIMQQSGRVDAEKFAMVREYNVMLNHVAAIKAGKIQTVRPDIAGAVVAAVAPESAFLEAPIDAPVNGHEPALVA